VKHIVLVAFTVLAIAWQGIAHVGTHPSVHDTIAGIADRLVKTYDAEAIQKLEEEEILQQLTEEERHVLASEYISFTVNTPVTVYIARYHRQREMPYWLEEGGFTKTELTTTVGGNEYELWKQDFDDGHIGLGINGFRGEEAHYFVIVQPQDASVEVDITEMYPGQHRVLTYRERAITYYDESDARVETLPENLKGARLIQTSEEGGEDTQLVRIYRTTPFPASTTPDQVVLTWSGDPQTTQAFQWRTNTEVSDGVLEYRLADTAEEAVQTVEATRAELKDTFLVNDPLIHRFTARIEGLSPATAYAYRVGSPTANTWSGWAEFTTAPSEVVPFSFVYMGDAQNGLETWGKLLHNAYEKKPEAAFYIMAGDLVNRGNQRDDWDLFFNGAAGVYDHRQLVPAIGNHECQGDEGPWMYLKLFDLLTNGPETVDEERSYALRYSNALFLIMDTNLPVQDQSAWLEEQLANTDAIWKFVVYHHPAYSSAPNRDNSDVRAAWGPVFDKYHVDMALQGHDHGYLRTYPMKDEKPVDSTDEGTVYVVSVSGTKYYKVVEGAEYAAKTMSNTSTYQVLDIRIDGNSLTYRAYDMDGEVRDEFVIEK
jgi:hypothetical protein